MPDGTDDDQLDASGLTPAERRILQAKADEADELRARIENMERQAVIRDAGLDLSDQQRKALEATHEGDWTADAIRQSATALGWIGAAPQGVPAHEAAGHQQMVNAATGAVGAPPPPTGGEKLMELKARLERAGIQDLQKAYPQVLDAIQEAGLNLGSVPFGSPTPISDWGSTQPS